MSTKLRTATIYGLVALTTLFAATGNALAAECTSAEACAALADGSIGIGAGLAIGLAGLGTGLAQKDIGAAAVGAVAEDPGFLGKSILYIAIPETIVIFGVLIAFLLLGKIA